MKPIKLSHVHMYIKKKNPGPISQLNTHGEHSAFINLKV